MAKAQKSMTNCRWSRKSYREESQKSENPEEDEAKNENSGEETGASAELNTENESNAEKKMELSRKKQMLIQQSNLMLTMLLMTIKDKYQKPQTIQMADDSSSIRETKDEEDTELKGNVQNNNGQATA